MIHCFSFIFGSCLGSFLCLVAERVPVQQSLLKPASHCLNCQRKLTFFELFPIVSALSQRFRCRTCTSSIPLSYFFSECLSGLLTVTIFFNGISLARLYLWFFLISLLTFSLVDIWYLVVEPKIVYPTTLVLYGFHFYQNQSFHFISCLGVILFLVCLHRFYPKKIGTGDLILLACWSLLFDVDAMVRLLFVASSTGLIYLGACRLLSEQFPAKIPFVPFLSLGLTYILLFN